MFVRSLHIELVNIQCQRGANEEATSQGFCNIVHHHSMLHINMLLTFGKFKNIKLKMVQNFGVLLYANHNDAHQCKNLQLCVLLRVRTRCVVLQRDDADVGSLAAGILPSSLVTYPVHGAGAALVVLLRVHYDDPLVVLVAARRRRHLVLYLH